MDHLVYEISCCAGFDVNNGVSYLYRFVNLPAKHETMSFGAPGGGEGGAIEPSAECVMCCFVRLYLFLL